MCTCLLRFPQRANEPQPGPFGACLMHWFCVFHRVVLTNNISHRTKAHGAQNKFDLQRQSNLTHFVHIGFTFNACTHFLSFLLQLSLFLYTSNIIHSQSNLCYKFSRSSKSYAYQLFSHSQLNTLFSYRWNFATNVASIVLQKGD